MEKFSDLNLDSDSPLFLSCDFCRKRKGRCDRIRPTCSRCLRHDKLCSYTPVKVPKPGPNQKITIPTNLLNRLVNTTDRCLKLYSGLTNSSSSTSSKVMQTQLSYSPTALISLYLEHYHPLLGLMDKLDLNNSIPTHPELAWSVMAIATLYHPNADQLGFYLANLADRRILSLCGELDLIQVIVHLHLNFFYHSKQYTWLGWMHSGLAIRKATMLGLHRLIEIPNPLKSNTDYQQKLKVWNGCHLADRCVGLLYGKTFFMNNECVHLLQGNHQLPNCPIHQSSTKQEECNHIQLEKLALIHKGRYDVMELLLITKIADLTTLYRKKIHFKDSVLQFKKVLPLQHKYLENKKIETEDESIKLKDELDLWKIFLNKEHPLDPILNEIKGNDDKIDNMKLYELGSKHVLLNNAIILYHYPHFQNNSYLSPPSPSDQATTLAYQTIQIYLNLMTKMDLLNGPFWYFTLSTSAMALKLKVKLDNRKLNFHLNIKENEVTKDKAKLMLNDVKEALENIKNPKYPRLHKVFLKLIG